MEGKRGQELSITTIILIVIGTGLLTVLVLGFTIGWQSLVPWIDEGGSVDTVRSECQIACTAQNIYTYCNEEKDLDVNGKSYSHSCPILSDIGNVTRDFWIDDCATIICPYSVFYPVTSNEESVFEEDYELSPGDYEIKWDSSEMKYCVFEFLGERDSFLEFNKKCSPSTKVSFEVGREYVECNEGEEFVSIKTYGLTSEGSVKINTVIDRDSFEDSCSPITEESSSKNFFEKIYSKILSAFSRGEATSEHTVLTESEIYDVLIYARDNGVSNFIGTKKKCHCGSNENCRNYAEYISDFSETRRADPLLVTSLMIQESDCRSDICSASSCGLLQVNLGLECGKNGLPSNMNQCRRTLLNNPGKNIEVGTRVLKEKYNEFKDGAYKSWSYKNVGLFKNNVNSCISKYSKYKEYREWDAALRGYNGWGCSKGSDVYFVENINSIYNHLLQKISPGSSLRSISIIHTVSQGETLFAIARNYDKTINEILEANPEIKNPNSIKIGQEIIIP